MLPLGMEHLAPRVSTVAPEGKSSREEVVHAQVEEGDILLVACAMRDHRVHAQIHVPIERRIVMSDAQSSR